MKSEIRNPKSEMRFAFILAVFIFFLLPGVASASQIYFSLDEQEVNVGDVIEATVLLDSHGQRVNAYAATINFPSDLLTVRGINLVSSIVTHWIDQPQENNGISFAGITAPEGFQGSGGAFFSVTFEATAEGTAELSTSNEQVLLHDGLGTATQITRSPLNFAIEPPSLIDLIPIDEVVDAVQETVGAAAEAISQGVSSAAETIGNFVRDNVSLSPVAQNVIDISQNYLSRSQQFAGALLATLATILNQFAAVIGGALDAIRKFADNPVVEAIAKKYVAPGAIGVSAVAVAPSLSTLSCRSCVICFTTTSVGRYAQTPRVG